MVIHVDVVITFTSCLGEWHQGLGQPPGGLGLEPQPADSRKEKQERQLSTEEAGNGTPPGGLGKREKPEAGPDQPYQPSM